VDVLASGTEASISACRHVPVRAINEPSGAMIALTPVVDATTTDRSYSIARQQVGPGRHLGGNQPVESDLVADHVAQSDLAQVEDDRAVARREVVRLQRRE